MNRKLALFLAIILVSSTYLCSCAAEKKSQATGTATKTQVQTEETSAPKSLYKDGTYEGKSPMTSESYYGKVKVTISKGAISEVDFKIFDTAVFKNPQYSKDAEKYKDMREMVLDEKYGPLVFSTSEVYMKQCVNELSGILKYQKALVHTQDIEKVDVVSGATWSSHLFKDAVKDGLSKAK